MVKAMYYLVLRFYSFYGCWEVHQTAADSNKNRNILQWLLKLYLFITEVCFKFLTLVLEKYLLVIPLLILKY